jgi:hypothetical protein
VDGAGDVTDVTIIITPGDGSTPTQTVDTDVSLPYSTQVNASAGDTVDVTAQSAEQSGEITSTIETTDGQAVTDSGDGEYALTESTLEVASDNEK